MRQIRSRAQGVVVIAGVLATMTFVQVIPGEAGTSDEVIGVLKSGYISTTSSHGTPLVSEGGVCDKDVGMSQFSAELENDILTQFDTDFVQSSTGLTGTFLGIPYEVCVEMSALNESLLEAEIIDDDVVLDPGFDFELEFVMKNETNGSTLFTCTTQANAGVMSGELQEPEEYGKDPGVATLELESDAPFDVAGVTGCPLIASLLNDALGLPSNDVGVELEFLLYADKPITVEWRATGGGAGWTCSFDARINGDSVGSIADLEPNTPTTIVGVGIRNTTYSVRLISCKPPGGENYGIANGKCTPPGNVEQGHGAQTLSVDAKPRALHKTECIFNVDL